MRCDSVNFHSVNFQSTADKALLSDRSIPVSEARFHTTSFCDQDGRLFWWQGELYRGISVHYAALCERLFAEGIVDSLVDKGFLVDTELTDFSLPVYSLVLKHRRIPFVSYASEWCPEMLKAAAQFTLDMMRQLAPYGLTVDIGSWDILYEGCVPRYVDFCSIAAASTYTPLCWQGAKDDFDSYFVTPLRLMAQGKGNLARWLLHDYEHRVIHRELAGLMGQEVYSQGGAGKVSDWGKKIALKATRFRQRWLPADTDLCRLDLVDRMQRSLDAINLPPPAAQDFSSVFTRSPKVGKCASTEAPQQTCVHRTLTELQPSTVLDVGCGTGTYAQMAARLGAQVIAIDRDDRQVACCYKAAKAERLSVLPLVMDIRYPTPGQGVGNQLLASARDRLSCELVLALDVLHLLVFEQHLTLPQAVQALADFSTRWLLLSFPDETEATRAQGYHLDRLMELLGARFDQVEMIATAEGQVPLILCEVSAM